MSTESGWPALGKEAASGSWRWSMEPPGLPLSRPRQTWSSGASTETATDASWWWVCGEGLLMESVFFTFSAVLCSEYSGASTRNRADMTKSLSSWMKWTERKGDRIQQKGAESEMQLRNIMHNCSVNENLRRPLLPTKAMQILSLSWAWKYLSAAPLACEVFVWSCITFLRAGDRK